MLARAIALHRSGKLREAEPLYAAVLAAEPDHPDALHFLGVLRHAQGASDEAAALIRRSLALAPGNPDAQNNLGNVLLETGQSAEAIAAYRRVVELRPDAAEAHHNLGVALRALGQVAAAEAAIEHAIALDPRQAVFHYSLAMLWLRSGRPQNAIPILQVVLALDPNFSPAHVAHIRAIRLSGAAPAAALAALDAWLEREPDNAVARHMRAAYSGEAVPARASDGYVRSLFVNYAATFDAHLDRLGYRAPQLLHTAIAGVLGEPRRLLDVLDAGCGTGLCGPLLRPFARRLAGVDLVEAMVAKARERDNYDELTVGELTAFLAARSQAYDLIVSADTLVYFGDLSAVASAASGALHPGGVLAFSLERRDTEDLARGYRLEEHGRYSHTADYVRCVVEEAGLAILTLEHAVPRNEGGAPVAGLVVVARKPADAAHSKA
ncbi:MAG TPA: tetratricopeptide repeat protein [Stellaceae bacterium]